MSTALIIGIGSALAFTPKSSLVCDEIRICGTTEYIAFSNQDCLLLDTSTEPCKIGDQCDAEPGCTEATK